MLAPEEVATYLMGRGLLLGADLVDAGVSIADVSRRNRNYRVVRPGGGGYLLKQAPPGPEGESIRREAVFLERCAAGGPLEALRPLVPRCLAHDPGRRILITELVAPARPFWRLMEDGDDPAGAAASLGSALAMVHRQSWEAVAGVDPDPEQPGVLEIDRPPLEALASLSEANLALLRVVQGDAPLRSGLARLQREWHPLSLVHGDVKGDNVLHLPAGPGAPSGGIRLVDWELAQGGDPAWDLGSAFHDFLAHWLHSIPLAAGTPVREQLARARRPLVTLRPAIRALWDGYRQAAGLEGPRAATFLEAAVRWCAARLVQAAYELGAMAPALPNASVAMLQLASNLFADSQPAAFELLGIPMPAFPSPDLGASPPPPPLEASGPHFAGP